MFQLVFLSSLLFDYFEDGDAHFVNVHVRSSYRNYHILQTNKEVEFKLYYQKVKDRCKITFLFVLACYTITDHAAALWLYVAQLFPRNYNYEHLLNCFNVFFNCGWLCNSSFYLLQ